MTARPVPAGSRAGGRVTPPPSKSLSNRYLNLGLLAHRRLRIERLLAAEDTEVFLQALAVLGWRVGWMGESVDIEPSAAADGPGGAEIWCGASGTMLRFLTASLSTLPGRWRIDGTPRLRQRPLGPLVEALRALGAAVGCPAVEGHAPVAIDGSGLDGGVVRLDASDSSQFASALLMAAPRARGPVEMILAGLVSAPYLELTVDALEAFGAGVERPAPDVLRVRPGLGTVDRLRVSGDYSSAAYWAAGAALTGGAVDILGLDAGSRQADRLFFDTLAAMGLDVGWRGDVLRATGGAPLVAVDLDLSQTPDQVPTLAVLAPFARGVTRIRNVAHLRIKESDRLAEVSAGLRAAGAAVSETADGLEIPGIWADRPPPTSAVTLDSVDDHRLAMSFAILGLRRPGISVSDADVVAKSYPGFWRDFESVFVL